MKLPPNRFKAALAAGKSQIGIWNSIGGNMVAELLASSGYDWILVDTEHAPVETVEVLPALQAIAGFPDVSAVVRASSNDQVEIKRLLDMGAQSLMIPCVETVEEAQAAVRAMRYPPRGARGMAGMVRATVYGQVENYVADCENELCLIVQIETAKAVRNLEAIAQTDGVDGIFIGPADLSASLGYPGQPGHPEVHAVIHDIIARAAQIGVPSGILWLNPDEMRAYCDAGTQINAVGLDASSLANAVRHLRQTFA